MPRVYHVDNAPKGAIYVGRGTKWGNPYKIGKDGNREQVISKYRDHAKFMCDFERDFIEPLVGKDLACHCAPKACHGDVLLELANPPEQLDLF